MNSAPAAGLGEHPNDCSKPDTLGQHVARGGAGPGRLQHRQTIVNDVGGFGVWAGWSGHGEASSWDAQSSGDAPSMFDFRQACEPAVRHVLMQ